RNVGGDVVGAPEHIDDVDGSGDVRQATVGPLSEDLGGTWVVDRNREDGDPGMLEVLWDVIRGLRGLFGRLEPEHRHPARLQSQPENRILRLDEVFPPLLSRDWFWNGHEPFLATPRRCTSPGVWRSRGEPPRIG